MNPTTILTSFLSKPLHLIDGVFHFSKSVPTFIASALKQAIYLDNAYIYPHGLHPSHSDLACLFYAHYFSLIYCAVTKLNRVFDVRSVPGEPLREGSA
jgi:hypothetical protein